MGPLQDTLAIILAGGQGERLYPLTRDRAKPAVPFGGTYRIIDFTLSNCLNSDCRRLYLLSQYKSFSLDRHLILGWSPVFNHPERGSYLHILPPQMRMGESWYLGTADAIFQNIYTLEREKPARVLILAGDHIYKMNYGAMLQAHLDKRAALTVGCIIVERKDAGQLGIAVVNADHRVQAFVEKPKENPPTLPGDSGRCLASMGIYVFETEELVRRVSRDARRESAHDFGKNIIPEMVQEQAAVYAYPFKEDNLNQPAYWRDVGTLDGYYEANMELVRPVPPFNLYDTAWPIRTYLEPMPPAKFVHNEMGAGGRRGRAHESLVPQGVIISGGLVERSVLSPGVRVNSFAHVEDSILMEGVVVGRRARLRKCIIDKGVVIPEGATVGFDPKSDAKRFAVSGGGITIIPKEMPV